MPYLENENRAHEARVSSMTAMLNYSSAAAIEGIRLFCRCPNVEASLREMERGLDELGMAGITFGCSILNRR